MDEAKSEAKEKFQSYAVDTNIGLIAMSLATIGIATLLLIYLSRKSGVFDVTPREVEEPRRPVRLLRRPGPRRPGADQQERSGRAPEFEATEDGTMMVPPDFSDDDELNDLVSGLQGNLTKKERAKMQKKEEKARMREAVAEAREAKAQREAEKQRVRDLKAAEEEEQEARKEAELAAAEAKRKQEEEEAYQQFVGSFQVEDEGFDGQTEEEFQSMLPQFINYIKCTKVVVIEELAKLFKLREQDCVSRLKSLQSSGTLSGVLDDRGKFIYVSSEEMQDLAKFIKRMGRISISELAECCTTRNIISLNPTDVPEVSLRV